jgi:hypothetical protein
MKRRKAGKALESAARAIRNSDEFVAHSAGIAALYRRERDLEGTDQRRELRVTLKALQRHAEALATLLRHAQPAGSARPEQIALQLIGEQGADTSTVHAWAIRAARAAARITEELKTAKPDSGKAVRTAADALKATFEHHKLKWSTSISKGEPAPGLKLLCAIARDAGDRSLTPVDARKALRAPAANQ